MLFKFISFLFFLILATLFITFNLENRCNISFVFYQFKDIPVFVSLLFAYCTGCISMLPFVLFKKKKPDTRSAQVNAKKIKDLKGSENLKDSSQQKKTRFGKKTSQPEASD